MGSRDVGDGIRARARGMKGRRGRGRGWRGWRWDVVIRDAGMQGSMDSEIQGKNGIDDERPRGGEGSAIRISKIQDWVLWVLWLSSGESETRSESELRFDE